MRNVLCVIVLAGWVGMASSADPPATRAEREALRQLEGVWVLKAAVVATPAGVFPFDPKTPNNPKMGLTIRDGVQDMTEDGKPIPNGRATLKLGSEAECLLLDGRPGQKPFKVRFKLEGDTLTVVQDMAFKEECPESFDAEKGRSRDRRVLTFTRVPQEP